MIPKECKRLAEVDFPIAVVGKQSQAANRHAELLARRERRRLELQQQRSLALQPVERIVSVLVLPHPQHESPKVTIQKPIKDPARFPWHDVSKVQHYWSDVNAMTRPMQVQEDSPPSGANHQ